MFKKEEFKQMKIRECFTNKEEDLRFIYNKIEKKRKKEEKIFAIYFNYKNNFFRNPYLKILLLIK